MSAPASIVVVTLSRSIPAARNALVVQEHILETALSCDQSSPFVWPVNSSQLSRNGKASVLARYS